MVRRRVRYRGRVGRSVLCLTVLCVLLAGGLASGLLAAPGRTGATTTAASATSTAVPTTTTTASTAREVLVFTGHGWGHGLGLSQWGAYGYASHGWSYDRILAHYYSGTSLGPASVSSVRVLVADARRTTLSSSVAWTVKDGAGASTALEPGAASLTSALAVNGAKLAPPLTFSSTAPISVDGRAYRGRLTVALDGKKVQVVDVVGLESYVKGVVPAEMPSNWPVEALKAQAVAARSYALANLQKGLGFDLYGDTRSQVYGGVAAESPAASAAVDATKGQVVLYAGKVADTVFSSTSGGRTANAADALGQAVPYLVSVADPYDTTSPYHDWGPVLVAATRLTRLLKLPGSVQDLRPTLGADGRVAHLDVVGPYGTQVTLTGEQVRFDLGLRSTWFTAALLALQPGKPIAYGGAAPLSGFARGAGAVTLESRAGTGAWQTSSSPALAADGTFQTVVSPQVTTRYRLAWNGVRAGLSTVSVAPLVTASVTPGAASGTIRPAIAAAPVELQWSADGATWQTVGQSTTDASGAFSVTGMGASGAGSYRVRVAPGHGLVPGYSKSS